MLFRRFGSEFFDTFTNIILLRIFPLYNIYHSRPGIINARARYRAAARRLGNTGVEPHPAECNRCCQCCHLRVCATGAVCVCPVTPRQFGSGDGNRNYFIQTATNYGLDGAVFGSRQGWEMYLLSNLCRPTPGAQTGSCVVVIGVLSPGLRRPWRQADHSSPSSAWWGRMGADMTLH
jgi:hypothetical protein